jgi:hypothetical protein
MFTRYWNGDPVATAEAVMDGWTRTGDLCRRDSEGYYWFEGAAKRKSYLAGDPTYPRTNSKSTFTRVSGSSPRYTRPDFTAGTNTRPQD